MTDIVERLCDVAEHDFRVSHLAHTADTAKEAVNTLAAQAAEIERLTAALRGLSDMYSHAWDSVGGDLIMMAPSVPRFEAAHKAARTALGFKDLDLTDEEDQPRNPTVQESGT